jgi:hypothetical protein
MVPCGGSLAQKAQFSGFSKTTQGEMRCGGASKSGQQAVASRGENGELTSFEKSRFDG